MSSSTNSKPIDRQVFLPTTLFGLARDVLNGRHALSKAIPPVLWLFDGLLCILIIHKIPCTLSLAATTEHAKLWGFWVPSRTSS